MLRIAKRPLLIPKEVKIDYDANGRVVTVQGTRGSLSMGIHNIINFVYQGHNEGDADVNKDSKIVTLSLADSTLKADKKIGKAILGTTAVLLLNMVTGVTKGFERKLQLIGVGYRAKVNNKVVELNLGYSDVKYYNIPEGVDIVVENNTEIIIKGSCKVRVGQVAAQLRALRKPEKYKGKGVRYFDEVINLKEVKKK